MTYRAIFFDAFGTLILWEESEPHLYLSQRLARVGLKVPPKKVADILKRWERDLAKKVEREPGFAALARERNRPFWDYFYTYLLREAGIEGDLSNYVTGIYEGFLDDESLYPDPEALELLPRLRSQGLILGMISNAPKRLNSLCQKMGLALDLTVTSAEVGAEKPDPAIFRAALSKAGVKPEEAVYVGDDYNNDVQGAERAGLKAVLLDRQNKHQNMGCPRVNRLLEIEALL
jgi:putative hydrolase of the HAD superfamily